VGGSLGRLFNLEGFRALPVWLRCAFGLGLPVAAAGAVVGLVVGIHVNPATAWFAVMEGSFIFGVPAFMIGALLGALVGGARWLSSRRHGG
jgi:glycerol uptake facilitator-like aquaporin